MSIPPPLQRLFAVLLLPLLLALGCAPGEFAAGAKTANTIASGVACGVAAANDTPCTPRALLDRLAALDKEQKATIAPVVEKASTIDPKLAETLIDELARNSASNERLTKAIFELASRESPSASSAPTTSSVPPPAAPTPPATAPPAASPAPSSPPAPPASSAPPAVSATPPPAS